MSKKDFILNCIIHNVALFTDSGISIQTMVETVEECYNHIQDRFPDYKPTREKINEDPKKP